MKRKSLLAGLIISLFLVAACEKQASLPASASSAGEGVTSETSVVSEPESEQPEESPASVEPEAQETGEKNLKVYTKCDGAGAIIYKIEYDKNGRPTHEYDNEFENDSEYTYELKEEDGNDVLSKYDSEGYLVEETVYYGHSLHIYKDSSFFMGKLNSEVTYNNNGDVLASKGPYGDLNSYEYDESGKLIKGIEYGLGYDTYSYDESGLLVEKASYMDSGELVYTEVYEYDAKERLIKRTESYTNDTGSTVATYSYDDNGYLIEEVTDYEGEIYREVYVRDDRGRELEFYDYAGTEDIFHVIREFDSHDNVVLESYYDMGSKRGDAKYVYTYDDDGTVVKKETFYDGELLYTETYEY